MHLNAIIKQLLQVNPSHIMKIITQKGLYGSFH